MSEGIPSPKVYRQAVEYTALRLVQMADQPKLMDTPQGRKAAFREFVMAHARFIVISKMAAEAAAVNVAPEKEVPQ